MSSKINISALPVAGEVTSTDFFIINNEFATKQIAFSDIIFGLDNVTFASTISAHTTEISILSTDVAALSSELYVEVASLTNTINTTVQAATGALVDALYPVGGVLFSTNAANPATYIADTTWDAIAGGNFIAGVGTGTDKNGDGLVVVQGEDTATGEYNHILTEAEMPAHTHNYNNIGLGNADGNDTLASQGVLFNYVGAAGAAANGITSTGSGTKHNNVPQFFGLYIWKRTS